ncbi:hypothetical protein HNQ91_002262 [Filimonas zeae]|nr:hypothetical protein [Filimonas zeae]
MFLYHCSQPYIYNSDAVCSRYAKNEIVADVLKQYERFVKLSSEEKNEIFIGVTLRRKT